jgi:antitoxin (DNA-binding transcriptional repressor) of toxin-antitoxin stability system
MTTIDIRTARTLEDLLKLIAQGEEVMIADGDTPVARLLPATAKRRRIPDLFPNSVIMADDFDDPLPDEFWLGSSKE